MNKKEILSDIEFILERDGSFYWSANENKLTVTFYRDFHALLEAHMTSMPQEFGKTVRDDVLVSIVLEYQKEGYKIACSLSAGECEAYMEHKMESQELLRDDHRADAEGDAKAELSNLSSDE